MNPDTKEPIYNESTVKKFIHLCSFGLVKGLGKPIEGKMCVEAAIALAHNLPHQDKNSDCVGEEVAKCKIALNDCNWSSNKARADGMLAIGIAQLGSNTIDQEVFTQQLKLNSIKIILPYLIQKHFKQTKDEKLLKYKLKFEQLKELDDSLWNEFYSYNYNCYNYYYSYNYYYACYECYKCYSYYGDKFLLLIASTILKTLQELDSPGCKFLHLIK